MNDTMSIISFLIIYAYVAIAIQTIANKTNTNDSWMAWIPILNIYLTCKIADRPGWWLILFVVPLVNLVVAIIVWMDIARKRGKPEWAGILTVLPVVNLVVWGYLAFSD